MISIGYICVIAGVDMVGAVIVRPNGYYEVPHTPGLWKHTTQLISFTLVVDNFGIKYVGRKHNDHLLGVLKQHYKLAEY